MGWAARYPDREALLNTGAFRNPKAQSLPPPGWSAIHLWAVCCPRIHASALERPGWLSTRWNLGCAGVAPYDSQTLRFLPLQAP